MRCANPPCHTESSYLRDGKLYSIDEVQPHSGMRRRRFIWLCRKCAPRFVVETWRPPGQQLRSAGLPEPAAPQEQRGKEPEPVRLDTSRTSPQNRLMA